MLWFRAWIPLGLAVAIGGSFAFVSSRGTPNARNEVACMNSATDAAVINAAIAASEPGDEIVIDGPCLITETIRLLGNRSYRGVALRQGSSFAPG